VPAEASQIYDGCGSPIEAASAKEGEIVVDLGSGGGYDVFRASKLVGQSGRVIGIDATPEMVWRARETAKKYQFSNVEFRLGEIEHLPMDSDSADVIVSNCVINLAPDKGTVFQEAYRVLKPGGRLVVSDTVAECTLKVDPKDLDAWTACAAGALPEDDYLNLITKTGFTNVEVSAKTQSCCSQGIASITVIAEKPK
jgi:ubiquinone/menaquinone biosynthesis C-methylase UbiE